MTRKNSLVCNSNCRPACSTRTQEHLVTITDGIGASIHILRVHGDAIRFDGCAIYFPAHDDKHSSRKYWCCCNHLYRRYLDFLFLTRATPGPFASRTQEVDDNASERSKHCAQEPPRRRKGRTPYPMVPCIQDRAVEHDWHWAGIDPGRKRVVTASKLCDDNETLVFQAIMGRIPTSIKARQETRKRSSRDTNYLSVHLLPSLDLSLFVVFINMGESLKSIQLPGLYLANCRTSSLNLPDLAMLSNVAPL